MPNPRLAGRYAKSLIDLAIEKDQLEVIYKDMQYLRELCKKSHDFVSLLRSPVIKGDKKQHIIETITRGKVSDIMAAFNRLLVSKGRESDLPEIANAFIDQYNSIKGIHKVKLTTAVPVSDELKKAIIAKTTTEAGLSQVELETNVKDDLIGGFVLEFNNNLVDASILRDLKEVKKQFKENIYVLHIR
jgi:F-type H+-transporting ATPase subunit delta